MVIDRRKATLYGSAAALRFLLFITFPSLSNLLTGRVEISTPVTSFKRCKSPPSSPGIAANEWIVQEGLFLYTHNVSPYDGGVFHQAPLLLPLFALIPSSMFSALTSLLYIGLDILCARALMSIAESGESASSRLFRSPRKDIKWDSMAVGAA